MRHLRTQPGVQEKGAIHFVFHNALINALFHDSEKRSTTDVLIVFPKAPNKGTISDEKKKYNISLIFLKRVHCGGRDTPFLGGI